MFAKPTVLVVEDSPLNMELFRELLRAWGALVIEAETASGGFELAASRSPDLVVLDLQLPDMDGLVALSAMKSDARTVGIPTLVVTAHAMQIHRERALAAGATGFLTKPIDFAEFRAELDRILGARTQEG